MINNSYYLKTTYSGIVDWLNSVIKKNNLNSNEELLDNSLLIKNSIDCFFSDKQFNTRIRKEQIGNRNTIPTYIFHLDLFFEENSNKKITLMFKLNNKKELYLYNGGVDFYVHSTYITEGKMTNKSYHFNFFYSSEYTPCIQMSDEKMVNIKIYFSNLEKNKKENLNTLNNEKKNISIDHIKNMYALSQLYIVNPMVVLDYFFLNKSIDESFKEIYDLTYDCNLKNIDFDQYFIDPSKQKKLKMVAK